MQILAKLLCDMRGTVIELQGALRSNHMICEEWSNRYFKVLLVTNFTNLLNILI
jgi:hypothetical protein